MAINFRKYVDITSGVGGRALVRTRDLIGRIYTTNPKCPAGGILEFDYLEDVFTYFGSGSEEYKRAAFYFGFISKTQVRPKKLSFVLWPRVDVCALLRGLAPLPDVEAYKTVTDGSFVLRLSDKTYTVTGCDLSGILSYADVADAVQTALRRASNKTVIKQATVAFDAEGGAFTLTAGKAEPCEIHPLATTGDGTFIGALLGLDASSEPVASRGMAAQTVDEALFESIDVSNNFGSFLFIGQELSIADAKQAAQVAHASNMQFMFCLGVTPENAERFQDALKGFSGTALTLMHPDRPDEYHDMAPMILLAATDYTRLNGTINYMFHQFSGLTPTVTTTPAGNAWDKLRVNYYGRTQQAGQMIDFYQRGLLCGDVQDMNIYANEMWLKDQAAADIMNLLLALSKVGANRTGRLQVMGCLQNTIEMALKNGAVSVGKKLNHTQRAYVLDVTGDQSAWQELETVGYQLDVQVEEMRVDERIEYKIKYLLLYAKGDIIRKVEGTHTLI